MSKSDEISQTSDEVTSSKYVEGVNEKNMDKFLAALRSEDFNQVNGRLCQVDPEGNPEGFCCLGVGSELAHQDEDFGLAKETYKTGENWYRVAYGAEELLAPVELMKWLGIPRKNRQTDDNGGYNIVFFKAHEVIDADILYNHGHEDDELSATELNDDLNLPFEVIADVFENEFKKESA